MGSNLNLRNHPAFWAAIGVVVTIVLAVGVVLALRQSGDANAVSDNAPLIAAVIALGGVGTTQMVSIALESRRVREARELEERRVRETRALEDARTKEARRLEAQRAGEAALQNYFEVVGELLIEKPLREASPDDNLSTVVRAQTLSVLEGLDPERKRILLLFLYESDLIIKGHVVVDLRGANLRGANLSVVNLRGASLSEVDLSETYLRRTNLRDADLMGSNLSGADLNIANLSEADLTGANLRGANLRKANVAGAGLSAANLSSANLSAVILRGADLNIANLRGANLREANLREANLRGVDLSEADLRDADLTHATMPNGQRYEEGRGEDKEIGVPQRRTTPINVAYPAADDLHLRIALGACRFEARPGAEQSWVGGTYHDPTGNRAPIIDTERQPVTITEVEPSFERIPNAVFGGVPRYKLEFGKGRPFALTIVTGVSEFDLDLGGVPLKALSVRQGAGRFNLNFSAPNPVPMSLLEVSRWSGRHNVREPLERQVL
jgi:uncharacterized protein YjbI with pentapeptide repeats